MRKRVTFRIKFFFKKNIKISYKKMNDIKNGYRSRTAILKDGKLITDKSEIVGKFRDV